MTASLQVPSTTPATTIYATDANGAPEAHLQAVIESTRSPSAGPAVTGSSLLESRYFDPNAMTPESLLVYVSTRVGALDEQMTAVFDRQRLSERVRKELSAIQQELSNLEESSDPAKVIQLTPETLNQIESHLLELEHLDPFLGADVRHKLQGENQLLAGDSGYVSGDLKNTREYLNSVSKNLESGAQMDMIQLQSFMSSRQTAIQLATNLIAALGETQKAVVTNIR